MISKWFLISSLLLISSQLYVTSGWTIASWLSITSWLLISIWSQLILKVVDSSLFMTIDDYSWLKLMISQYIFSRESDSRSTNVRSFVRSLVCQSAKPQNIIKSIIPHHQHPPNQSQHHSQHHTQHYSHNHTQHDTPTPSHATSQKNITQKHHT